MELQFTIRPGVDPMDRGDLEDLVVEALGNGADCLGGGGMMDGSMCDFTIEVDGLSVDEVVAKARAALGAVSFSMPTEITLDIDEDSFDIPTAPPKDPPDDA